MTGWDAEQFYEENEQSMARFLIATTPAETEIINWLPRVLSQILREQLGGHGFLGTVFTATGNVEISSEQYTELLRLQERRETESSRTE